MHLLSMVTLYASAISFTVIGFQYINLWIPDVLDPAGMYAGESARSLIRSGLAFLIIMFPVYFWTAWTLRKSYAKEPARRKLWIRRWLVYFTLFVAALIIIGSFVALMKVFLDGELTLRFALKLLILLFVTGSIFGFYLWDEKRYEGK